MKTGYGAAGRDPPLNVSAAVSRTFAPKIFLADSIADLTSARSVVESSPITASAAKLNSRARRGMSSSGRGGQRAHDNSGKPRPRESLHAFALQESIGERTLRPRSPVCPMAFPTSPLPQSSSSLPIALPIKVRQPEHRPAHSRVPPDPQSPSHYSSAKQSPQLLSCFRWNSRDLGLIKDNNLNIRIIQQRYAVYKNRTVEAYDSVNLNFRALVYNLADLPGSRGQCAEQSSHLPRPQFVLQCLRSPLRVP